MGRRNRLRERLAAGDRLVGAYVSFPSPELVEFLGHAGFDWAFFDAEHGGIGLDTCYALVRAADAVALPTMVRVPVNEPSQILRFAETGANAIMVPHVQSLEDGHRFVDALRYWPDGQRGAMSASRAANYGLTQTAEEYFADSDAGPLAVALIEDKRACEDISEIATARGVDLFFLGPGDLAMSLGRPAQLDHPDVVALLRETTKKLVDAGCAVGTIVPTAAAARAAFDAGMRLVIVSAGMLLGRQIKSFLAEARED